MNDSLREMSTSDLWIQLKAAADRHRAALNERTMAGRDTAAVRKASVAVIAAKKKHEAMRQELIRRGEIKR